MVQVGVRYGSRSKGVVQVGVMCGSGRSGVWFR